MTPGSSDPIKVGPIEIRFVVESADSDGAVAAFEFDLPAESEGVPEHNNHGYTETIYVREGVLSLKIDGVLTEVGAGEAFCIPRGVPHRFDNSRDVPLKALAIVVPAVVSPDSFRERAKLVRTAGGNLSGLATPDSSSPAAR